MATATGVSALNKLKGRAASAQPGGERELLIPLDKLRFDPTQPRQAFHAIDGRVAEQDQEYIEDLARTIKSKGLIEAITVRELGDGTYMIVVGECRTRAHLLLGLPTIRATVRNDLTNSGQRLAFQIIENVNRKNLSDEELALSVRRLLESGNDGKPMSQVEVARLLEMRESQITRLVRFGDEELQRVWVKTGIVDTVETLYRVSTLSKETQMSILRRVGLPEDDPEWLEIPLKRFVIDRLQQEAKMAKERAAFLARTGADAGGEAAAGAGNSAEGGGAGLSVVGSSEFDQAVAGLVDSGKVGEDSQLAPGASGPAEESGPSASSGYQLSEEARNKLLAGEILDTTGGSSMPESDFKKAPIPVRASVGNMEKLLALIADDPDMLDFARNVRCDLFLPHSLAVMIASKMAGVIVGDEEVAQTVQSGLVNLE